MTTLVYNISDDTPVYYGKITRTTPKSIWIEYKFENGYVENVKWTKNKNNTWSAKGKPGSLGTDKYTFEFREIA